MGLKPGYKQTEIGPLPEDWDCIPFSKFVAIQRGHDLTARQRQRGDIPVMGSAGLNGYHNTAKAEGPGVVIGRSGASYGQAHWCEVDFWPHNTALYVTDFLGNDPRFAFYALRETDFSRHNSGGAQQSLNRNFIAGVLMARPPRKVQLAIRECLDDMETTVDAMLDLIAKKRDLRAGAMHRLLSGACRLPDFSKQWEEKRLGELADLHKIQVIPGSRPGDSFEHYSLPAFDSGKNPAIQYGSEIGSNKFSVPRNAILVSKLNPRIPRIWAPEVISETAVASTEFLVLIPKEGVSRQFLKVLCSSESFCSRLENAATGTTGSHQRVAPSEALRILVSWPTELSEQNALAEAADAFDAEITALEARLEKTRALKQGMMQALLTGRVRLPVQGEALDALEVAHA